MNLGEFGSDDSDPEIQYTSYFLLMNDSQMRLGTHKESFEKHLCPTLGIGVDPVFAARRSFASALGTRRALDTTKKLEMSFTGQYLSAAF